MWNAAGVLAIFLVTVQIGELNLTNILSNNRLAELMVFTKNSFQISVRLLFTKTTSSLIEKFILMFKNFLQSALDC